MTINFGLQFKTRKFLLKMPLFEVLVPRVSLRGNHILVQDFVGHELSFKLLRKLVNLSNNSKTSVFLASRFYEILKFHWKGKTALTFNEKKPLVKNIFFVSSKNLTIINTIILNFKLTRNKIDLWIIHNFVLAKLI